MNTYCEIVWLLHGRSSRSDPTPMTIYELHLVYHAGTPSHQPDLYYPTTTTSNEYYIESQVDTQDVIQYNDNTLAPAG